MHEFAGCVISCTKDVTNGSFSETRFKARAETFSVQSSDKIGDAKCWQAIDPVGV
jgi:hypothetical protein